MHPLAFDRYAYTFNNPLRYTDPSGHYLDDGCQTEGCSTYKKKHLDDIGQVVEETVTGDKDDTYNRKREYYEALFSNGVCVGNNCSGTWDSNLEWVKWNMSMLPYEIGRRHIECEGCAYPVIGIAVDILGIIADIELALTFGTEVGLTTLTSYVEATYVTAGAITMSEDRSQLAQDQMVADTRCTKDVFLISGNFTQIRAKVPKIRRNTRIWGILPLAV
jgi:hypothetical protein